MVSTVCHVYALTVSHLATQNIKLTCMVIMVCTAWDDHLALKYILLSLTTKSIGYAVS